MCPSLTFGATLVCGSGRSEQHANKVLTILGKIVKLRSGFHTFYPTNPKTVLYCVRNFHTMHPIISNKNVLGIIPKVNK
jgi:hypothetical protein